MRSKVFLDYKLKQTKKTVKYFLVYSNILAKYGMRFLIVTQSYAMELKIVYCSTESSKLSSTRKIV